MHLHEGMVCDFNRALVACSVVMAQAKVLRRPNFRTEA